jgi:hypothetical protein
VVVHGCGDKKRNGEREMRSKNVSLKSEKSWILGL